MLMTDQYMQENTLRKGSDLKSFTQLKDGIVSSALFTPEYTKASAEANHGRGNRLSSVRAGTVWGFL